MQNADQKTKNKKLSNNTVTVSQGEINYETLTNIQRRETGINCRQA